MIDAVAVGLFAIDLLSAFRTILLLLTQNIPTSWYCVKRIEVPRRWAGNQANIFQFNP
jgi:hypothetical protein